MGWCEGCFRDSDTGTHAEGCRFSADARWEALLAKQTARVRELEDAIDKHRDAHTKHDYPANTTDHDLWSVLDGS